MRLYLVRHAEAAPGEPDELRPLTHQGRETARELGLRLREEGVQPDAVLTSPLLRARETGDELARSFDLESQPDERLAPGAGLEDLLAVVKDRGEHVVAVGHQPDCGDIAAQVTGEPPPPFPAGGMVVLELG